jgi:hypothetical protein
MKAPAKLPKGPDVSGILWTMTKLSTPSGQEKFVEHTLLANISVASVSSVAGLSVPFRS